MAGKKIREHKIKREKVKREKKGENEGAAGKEWGETY